MLTFIRSLPTQWLILYSVLCVCRISIMIPLARLISEYPILQSLSPFVSTLDLFHIALACKANYTFILSFKRLFNYLRRQSLWDGRGLAERQAFTSLYSLEHRHYNFGYKPYIFLDKPIGVHLYNLEYDEAAALPCRTYSINIYEEYWYYLREPPYKGNRRRYPYLNASR
jgi:hypothetical protein